MVKQQVFYNTRIKYYEHIGNIQITVYSCLHNRGGNKPQNKINSTKTGSNTKVPLKVLQARAKRIERSSAARAKNIVYDYARSNYFEWFITITFAPEKVDSFNYNVVVKKLGSYLDRIRRKCPDIKYIIIPERHKSGRFHFHGLFANCDNLGFIPSGHTTADGEPIYNIGSYRLGFTTATKITDNVRASNYIAKYITKDLLNHIKGKKRFWHSRNLQKPKERYILIENPNNYNFEENAEYHKQIKHYSSQGTEYINFYEYSASNKAVKGLPLEATEVNP